MDEGKLTELLDSVRRGSREVAEVVEILKGWPAERLGFACLDHHRALRTGLPEVIYGEGKSAEQIGAIFGKMAVHGRMVMATRVDGAKAALVRRELPSLVYHEQARMLTSCAPEEVPARGRGVVGVLSAGTSDMPVAEEALVTARCLGNRVEHIYDVGVAGIHRLLAHRELLQSLSVLIVVAGMEGALPSVVGGLVDKPIIAVPTSVGYGTGFGGIAALLGMLNSCAPGISVVNIDNGFGAACAAAAINRG